MTAQVLLAVLVSMAMLIPANRKGLKGLGEGLGHA
jgi:hypothetical protein